MTTCFCVDPDPSTCAACKAEAYRVGMNTSITYHGDCPSYPYRVVENGLWIASVASYSTGDNVLTGLALARIYVNVLERLSSQRPCPSCGDLTSADVCAACSEVNYAPIDVDFVSVGRAG
jgi:hypothetical protein